MLREPNSGIVVGDSFDIANYLEDKYPHPSGNGGGGGSLFPPDLTGNWLDYESPNKDLVIHVPLTTNEGKEHGDYARFNLHVDATFTAHVGLVGEYMPFNPSTAERVRKLFAKRAHIESWDDVSIKGEARDQLKSSFKTALTSLAHYYHIHHDQGPYLEGQHANYGDLIVGGWVNMLSKTMPPVEWEEFRGWHGGVFGRLHDALQEHYFVCT